MTLTSFVIIICLSLLLITIFLSLGLIYGYRLKQCETNPIPYCYDNYGCNTIDGFKNLSQETIYSPTSVANACSPITSENFNNFQYLDSDGKIIYGNPSQEYNSWYDDYCISHPSNINCPPYKIGDIYWNACYGGSTSKYYSK